MENTLNRSSGIKKWSYEDAVDLYGINNWGKGLFDISKKGEVRIRLSYGKDKEKWVSLFEIAQGVDERGLSMPVLLRFSDLLKKGILNLNKTFNAKIKESNYQGEYQGVYPIKVNQQQQVIEEITEYGYPYKYGLEAGSKAELIVAIAYIKNPDSLIICNGYKDREYIDLALSALKLGLKVFLVLERPSELDMILERALALHIEPNLGLRVKLSSTVGGRWAESAGDHSVFGLTAAQIVGIIDYLKQKNQVHLIKLLHYHLGSQIPDIKSIRLAVSEAVRYYIELVREGADMKYLDIGGGLAVDYDGSKTNFVASRNYSLDEYCADVLEVIINMLQAENIAHPTIVTESGRAVVAFYSVLLFNILDVNCLVPKLKKLEIPPEAHENIKNLNYVLESISIKNLQEMYHDAIYYRDELRSLFQVGKVSLRERGIADQIFWRIIKKITTLTSSLKYIPEELQNIEKVLADIYYGNFSLFQSLPDSWAIDQLFPIMPIHRLNEKPINPAIIADITCDCDGKIDRFIDLYNIKNFLYLHDLKPNEPYLIGTFLVGAYQETLGDLHNLFGDTNIVSISLDDEGEIHLEKELSGDSVADVLSYVEYDLKRIMEQIRTKAETAVRKRNITPIERKEIMKLYEEGIQGYTYFEE